VNGRIEIEVEVNDSLAERIGTSGQRYERHEQEDYSPRRMTENNGRLCRLTAEEAVANMGIGPNAQTGAKW
jgi:hypothetical protein